MKQTISLLLLLLPLAAAAAELRVRITGVRSGGTLRVSLFRSPKGFPGKQQLAYRGWVRPARPGTMTAVFSGLAPGIYAVAVHHDANGNGKMDTNFFGRPREGWCVSNNAPLRTFGPAKFEDARFVLKRPLTRLLLKMRY